jgi:hypothetical protein
MAGAPNLEQSLLLRPFPQEPPSGLEMKEFQRRYRDGMIQQAGICIFICGLKENAGKASGSPVIAGGVMEEFESAKRLQRILLPIGATGGAAQTIWNHAGKELNKWCPHISRKDYDRLNDAKQKPKALADIVGRVIAAADKARPTTRKRITR